jgi:hypothetical protein
VERGWGVNILEDARHSSVLYICKYFVDTGYTLVLTAIERDTPTVLICSADGRERYTWTKLRLQKL